MIRSIQRWNSYINEFLKEQVRTFFLLASGMIALLGSVYRKCFMKNVKILHVSQQLNMIHVSKFPISYHLLQETMTSKLREIKKKELTFLDVFVPECVGRRSAGAFVAAGGNAARGRQTAGRAARGLALSYCDSGAVVVIHARLRQKPRTGVWKIISVKLARS